MSLTISLLIGMFFKTFGCNQHGALHYRVIFSCVYMVLQSLFITVESASVTSIAVANNQTPMKDGTIQLVCNINNFENDDLVEIYKTSTGTLNKPIQALNSCLKNECENPRIGRYTFTPTEFHISITIVSLNINEDQKYWHCKGTDNLLQTLWLRVYIPITSVQLTSPTLSLVTVSENIGFNFTCVTSEGKPSATIQWYKKPETGEEVYIPGGTISPLNSDTLVNTTSILNFVPFRNDHNYNIYCKAYNIDQYRIFTSQNKPKVYVQYPADQPTIQGRSNNGEYKIIEEKQQTLTCTVAGGRPLPNLILTCLNRNISGSSTATTVTRQATWTASRDQEGEQCSCQSAHVILAWNKQVTVTLKVLYPPTKPVFTINGQNVSDPVSVIEQTTTIVKCHSSSLPSATYIWNPQEAFGGELTLSNIQSDNNGNVYTCEARNAMVSSLGAMENGTASNQFSLKVLYPPKTPVLRYGNDTGQIITPLQSISVVREDDFSINCAFTSMPAPSSYQWSGQTDTVNSRELRVTRIQNDSSWNCTAYNIMTPTGGGNFQGSGSVKISASVLYGPSSPIMTYHPSGGKDVLLQSELRIIEGRSLSVTCGKSVSKPGASYSWSSPIPSSSERLEISSIGKRYDNRNLTCIAKNEMDRTFGPTTQGRKETTQKLIVLYGPTVHSLSNETIVENQTFTKICQSDPGNPPVTQYMWTLNDGSTHNQQTLAIQRVTRTNFGMYTCEARNNMDPSGESITRGEDSSTFWLNILYASSISHFTINGQSDSQITLNHTSTLSLSCLVDSNPGSTITIKRDNRVLPSISDGVEATYTMTDVRCTDAGVYSCTAFNEYNGESRHTAQQNVMIRSPPVAVEPENNKTFYVAVHDSITVSLTVCAYPWPSSVLWYKFDNDTGSTIIKTDNKSSTYPHFNLTIEVITMTDFGAYQIVLDNGLTPMLKHQFYIVAQGPPEVPSTVNFDSATLTHDSLLIKWSRGFNGGLEQTFYIQYRPISDTTWTTLEVTDTGEDTMNITLTGLNPGTAYEVRVYAGNAQGNSSTTEPLQFTTNDTPSSAGNIGVILGAASGSVAALIIIVVIVFLQRRYHCIGGKHEKDDETKMRTNMAYEHNDEEDEEDGDVLVENAAYVSAGPYIREDAIQSTEYATVNKPKVVTGGDIYAQVNKKKPEAIYAMPDKKKGGKKDEKDAKDKKKGKGKAEKKKKGGKSKGTHDDTYENAEIGAVGQRPNDENLYELTDTSAKSSRKVNEDGLIYIDVVIDNNNKKKGGQHSNEIHGKDDMTEYTMIDFCKRADPLPDSDTEEK